MIKRDKRGVQLAVSTLIMLVIGIVVLIFLIVFLTGNWGRFMDTIRGYQGSERQGAMDLCENQCSLLREYDFCCSNKTVDKLDFTCEDLEVSCDKISCEGMC